jgi:hypothetical protein
MRTKNVFERNNYVDAVKDITWDNYLDFDESDVWHWIEDSSFTYDQLKKILLRYMLKAALGSDMLRALEEYRGQAYEKAFGLTDE